MSPRVEKPEVAAEEKPLVSTQSLDLRILEDEDRELTVPVNFYRVELVDGQEEIGDFVSQEWITYPVRAQLPIPTMTSLLRLEARINEALAADDDEAEAEGTDGRLEKALTDSYRRITSIIVERTPHALRTLTTEDNGEAFKIKPVIELDTTQVLGTLSWIAGDASVADAVAKTLSAGRAQKALSREDIEEAAQEHEDRVASSSEASSDVPFP